MYLFNKNIKCEVNHFKFNSNEKNSTKNFKISFNTTNIDIWLNYYIGFKWKKINIHFWEINFDH